MKPNRHRWFVVFVFFLFMLLHQSDRLLIGPLTSRIMESFAGITMTQMGAVSTGALVVGAIFYPLWGYLYDRFSRPRLLAMASLLWGATTWLNAISPTYPFFLITRASTGIDDASYPGIYSLVADYFGPRTRGKIYGLLQLTMPIGYLLGMVMGLMLGGIIGWRSVFYITGSLGIAVAFLVYFGVREAPRGQAEPELENIPELSGYRFRWSVAKDLFKKPSLNLLFIQGFFGVFPWNVITFWFFVYLEKERFYSEDTILITMVPAVLVLALGYPLGGALGDALFRRTPRGRLIVSTLGVVIGAVLMYFLMQVPLENTTGFMVMLCLTALFIPFASANVISTVYDVTLPEVRSTAVAVENFIESAGAALAPLIAGRIADAFSLSDAILWICLVAWGLCTLFFIATAYWVPNDIRNLHTELKLRADLERIEETPISVG